MKKILFALMMIAPVCCMAQTYNRDSLEALVAQNIKVDSTGTIDYYLKQMFPVTDSLIKDEGIRERLKADLMLNLIDMTCAENIQPYIDKYLVCSHTDSLQAKVKARFAKFMDEYGAIQPGRMAPDISFTNLNGKTMHLSDLRGKVVLVDVWGTWCAPCREEMPYIEKLQQRYAKDQNVHIMSIACDKKVATWKNFLTAHKTSWHQYLVTPEGDKVLDKVYHVIGIPRFMVIGKDGHIVSADTLRPSEPTFNKFFDDIVNK